MKLKTYEAGTMADALTKVRRELGRNAVILHTRTVKRGGLLGLGGRRLVEVTASNGINVLHPVNRRTIIAGGGAGSSSPAGGEALGTPAGSGPAETAGTTQLRDELQVVKGMVQELIRENRRMQNPSVPEELFSAYLALINQEVSRELASDIIRRVQTELGPEGIRDERRVREALGACVEKMIPEAAPIRAGRAGEPRIVALVGPTGVGKTTTIAKLAANFKLRENKSVGLITIDTYRIAAVDQLRTYANIINVPLRVVLSPPELREAVGAMRDLDIILIDTAGRSQRDRIKLSELKSFLDAAQPDETHLVLSSTASQGNLRANLQEFSSLRVDRIIFTKLDEAVGVGILLNVMGALNHAVSYITTGQNVPEDIEQGSGRYLARLIVGQVGGAGSAETTEPASRAVCMR